MQILLSYFTKNRELIISLVGGFFLLLGFTFSFFEPLTFFVLPLYILSYIFCSYDLISHAMYDLKEGSFKLNIDFLMILAAVGAASIGQWAEGGLLLFLFSLAHALEHYALNKAKNAIKALGELAPQQARVLREDRELVIPIEEVIKNDIVIVLPSERISVDGIVQSGNSSVDQSPITGESVPVEKKAGDEVFAGTINGNGAIKILTLRASGDRTLDRIIKLVEEAQTQKAPTEVFTNNFEKVFVPLVLVSSVLVITLPPLFGLLTFSESFYRAMSLLVGASPCALALGTPSAVLAGIAQAARNGVLIKGGAYLENLGAIKAIAFDKTGTLTIGEPVVTDVITSKNVSELELLKIAAAVEKRSQHPLAKAVVRKAQAFDILIPESRDVQSITAKGIRSEVEGKIAEIGSLRLWEFTNEVLPDEIRQAASDLQQAGKSIIIVKYGEQWLGVLGVRDTPRESAKKVISELRILGIKSLIMLTGDNKGIGESVGREVGIDLVYADLFPEDKVRIVKELISNHRYVAMVGDGVNDAPALAHATVGICMGGAGTATALETSDIALMSDDLSKLPFAVGLSRATRKIIKINLSIALFVIALLIVCTTSGIFGMGIAVILHEGSTMVVILNSLRLLGYKR